LCAGSDVKIKRAGPTFHRHACGEAQKEAIVTSAGKPRRWN